jgi:hypothetical protein
VTPPRGPRLAAWTRPPLVVLVLLYLIPIAAAFITPVSDFLGPQGDVSLYLDKARGVVSGLVPYREIPLEYPPLALVPMTVPYLLWPFGEPSLQVYPWLFAGEQAVLLLAVGVVVGRIVSLGGASTGSDVPQRRVGVQLLLLAAATALAITWRFDLFPTLLAVVALWMALMGRPVPAGVAIGVGVLAKLFPIAIAPALAVAWLAPRSFTKLLRFGEAVLGGITLGMVPFIALAGLDALIFIAYQTERGLQIESVGGALVLLGGLLAGQPIPLIAPFSAHEVTGGFAEALLATLPLVTAAAFGVLAWIGWRRVQWESGRSGGVEPATLVTIATASMLLLVVTSKVFSIQYAVWLVPFLALLPRRRFVLGLGALSLTMPIHPILYDALVRQEALPVLVLNLRNTLLVVLAIWVVLGLRARDEPKGGWAWEWRARRDSNPRPSGPQPDALSAELRAHDVPAIFRASRHSLFEDRGEAPAGPRSEDSGGEGGIRTLEAGYPT